MRRRIAILLTLLAACAPASSVAPDGADPEATVAAAEQTPPAMTPTDSGDRVAGTPTEEASATTTDTPTGAADRRASDPLDPTSSPSSAPSAAAAPAVQANAAPTADAPPGGAFGDTSPTADTPTVSQTPEPAQPATPTSSPGSEPQPSSATQPETGPTFHLATNGNDAGNGSSSEPWRTWTEALPRLRPGDTLLVHDGTWAERVQKITVAPASSGSPIVVKAASGARPVLMGLLWLHGADHWRLEGLRITWDPATGARDEHMVKFTDGVGWRLVNSEIWGARSFAGVLVADGERPGPSDWRIAGNCIHDTIATNGTNQDHLIYVNSGLGNSGGVIERNILFGAANGNGIKLAGPAADTGGTAGVTVTYNTIHDAAAGVLIGWQSSRNTISRNIVGGMPPTKGAVRAFQLSGLGNRFVDNVVFAADQLVFADSGFTPVELTGNRHPLDPGFNATGTCAGYRTSTPDAAAFGRYG